MILPKYGISLGLYNYSESEYKDIISSSVLFNPLFFYSSPFHYAFFSVGGFAQLPLKMSVPYLTFYLQHLILTLLAVCTSSWRRLIQ